MRSVVPLIFLVVAATAAPQRRPPTQNARTCDAVQTNSTAQLEDAVSSLLDHTTATGDFRNALAALLANSTGNSAPATPEGGTGSSTGASDDSSTPSSTAVEVTGVGPEVSVSDSGILPAWVPAWLGGSDDDLDDTSDDASEDTSDSAPDDPIYSASPRPATQDRAAGSPAAAGGAATQDRPAPAPAAADRAAPADAPSPARVAAGTEAGLQSAANGVNIANDVVRGGSDGVSDAIRDGARATANGAEAADIAGPPPAAGGGSSRASGGSPGLPGLPRLPRPSAAGGSSRAPGGLPSLPRLPRPSTGGGSSRASGGPPSLPNISPGDVAAGANAVAGGARVASAIGNLAGAIPRPPPPPGSLGSLRGIGGGRGPLIAGGPPGLGRLPGGFRRLGPGLRKRQSAQP